VVAEGNGLRGGEMGKWGFPRKKGDFQWLLPVGAIAVAVAAPAFFHCNLTISSQNCFGVCGRVVLCVCVIYQKWSLYTQKPEEQKIKQMKTKHSCLVINN